jgi:hypothetical protein
MAKFAGAVFAAPMISSFALDGIAQARPDLSKRGHQHYYGNMSYGNMAYGNMTYGNMACGNMTYRHHYGNMSYGNMAYGNMAYGNMAYGNMTRPAEDPFWWAFGECFPFDNHHHRQNWWRK